MSTALPMAVTVRFHLSLNVANLERSIGFYRVLFGVEPAKRRADYAKFELDDPPLVLSLEPTPRAMGGPLNHLGFRLPDSEALVAAQARLETAGIRSQREEGVECCYARQTKFWVTDPDGTLWEIYTLEEDLDHRGAGQSLEQMLPFAEEPKVPEVSWEHRLGAAVPERLPLANSAAGEVQLRGTFNADLPAGILSHLVEEAQRVLKPGGRLMVHVLVADRAFPKGPPRLPGPAVAVQRVPLEEEPLRALEAAGFTGLHLSKFGESPCFQHDGVEMREMMLEAVKPAEPGGDRRLVLYKGPFRQVVDDEGMVYPRGERVAIGGKSWELLRHGPAAEQFLFFAPRADINLPLAGCAR